MSDILQSTTLSDITDGMRSTRADLMKEEAEINALYNVRLPIIQRQRSTIETYLQGMGEAVDFESKLKDERREDFELIQSRTYRQASPNPTSVARSAQPTTSSSNDDPDRVKRTYTKRVISPIAKVIRHKEDGHFHVTDDIVLRIASVLEEDGPLKGGILYLKMVERKFIKAIGGKKPAMAFALALVKYEQDVVVYNKQETLWGTPKQFRMSQAQIKAMREERVATLAGAAAVRANTIAQNGERSRAGASSRHEDARMRESLGGRSNGNGQSKTPLARFSGDPTESTFVVCLNCIFRDQRNQPIGANQLWEIIKDDNTMNVTGVRTYDELKERLTAHGEFFKQDPSSKGWYPLHPYAVDPRQTLRTSTGEHVPIY